MLFHLRARNLGVLEDASIEPGTGFTVITGETGTGKTLLLGALRLLAGEKAKQSAVGPFSDEATAEGLFAEGDSEFGLTRVVPREGKSRAYLDGNLVAANVLVGRLEGLVEIVGQHDQLLLEKSRSVLALVDGMLDEKGSKVRSAYLETWARYRSALDDQRRLGGNRMGLERELDLVRYQANDIAAAGLEPGDDRRLESMASRLRNSETMREQLGAATDELESVVENAGTVVSRLRKLVAIDPELDTRVAAAESIGELAHDLLRSVRDLAETSTEDPEALEAIEQRLTSLGELKRKYGKTLDEVLEFGVDAARRATELEELLDKASGIEDVVRKAEADLVEIGARLTAARHRAIEKIEDGTRSHLAALGLASASVHLMVEAVDPGPSGTDRVDLMFASDDRLMAGAVRDVASGGELSRLVLALRLATRSKDTDTLVFDEVDAGVGGATALALGRKLADLAGTCQVLCVTHLPQVAAHADVHYVVERTKSTATVRRVDDDERLTELSRMLAGLPDSERGREAAAELLEGARS
ncbi:MAG: DNA repair protein RecN [Acidimicrobiia bacterium]